MIIGKVKKQENVTLREFIEECADNDKVFYMANGYFISFDKFQGIKVMPTKRR